MPTCPHCFNSTSRNGYHPGGKQKFLCRNCGKQHVKNPQHRCVPEPIREEICRLLRKSLLQGICRTKKVSMPWLLKFSRQIEEELPKNLNARPDSYALVTLAIDGRLSVAGKTPTLSDCSSLLACRQGRCWQCMSVLEMR